MKYPVTCEEYARFLNECAYSKVESDRYVEKMQEPSCGIFRREVDGQYEYIVAPQRRLAPVVFVSWFDAYDYASWLGMQLLTEEQWEVLARGNDLRKYSWGDFPEPTGEICNMIADGVNYSSDIRQYLDTWQQLGLSSAFGAYELTGNVWEWVDTYWYDVAEGRYDPSKSFTNYNDKSNRVLRGGCWGNDAKWLYAAARNNDITPYSRRYSIGFRCGINK